MSTYTDLHNRVKENLTVDYNTRITTQKMSAMNEENLFVGTFRGAFKGGSISQVSCIDCFVLSGLAERQLMVEPLLSVGYDVQTQEPVISSLTSYIEAHGGNISVDAEILSTSINPVQNKVIFNAFEHVRDYITNILGTQITDLINKKFKTLEDLITSYPPQDQEVGKSAIVYDIAGNAKFYTIELEGQTKIWKEVPTKESMYVSKTTDVDKLSESSPVLFSAGISPIDSTKLEQILSDYTDYNDHVPTSKLVKTTAEQLSAMIVEGSSGAAEWIKNHFEADQLSDVIVKNALSSPSADISQLNALYLSAAAMSADGLTVFGDISSSGGIYVNGISSTGPASFSDVNIDGSLYSAGNAYFTGDISASTYLSVGFDKVIDTAEHQLSDMLRDLDDSAKVLAVCIRVNEIKTLADLSAVPAIDYTTDNVEKLFESVKKIAYPKRQDTVNFKQAVESLNMSLGELKSAQTGVSLETRLSILSESIYGVADYVDTAIDGIKTDVTYLSSQVSAISPATEARLASVEGRVTAIESDYLKNADKTSLQSQISQKVSYAELNSRIESEKKQFCQQAYNALSALPADPQVLDIDTVSKVLFDIRSLLNGLKA